MVAFRRLIAASLCAAGMLLGIASPASAALSYDQLTGTPHNSTTAGSTTVTLTSAGAGEVIILCAENNAGNLSSVASSHLTWHLGVTSNPAGAGSPEQFYWAYASSALSAEVVTITLPFSAFVTADAFGVKSTVGFNSSNPFDSNASLPYATTVTTNDVIFSTTSANSFGFACYRSNTQNGTPGSGFTAINPAPANFHMGEYQIFSTPQTNVDFTIGGGGAGTQNGGVGSAVIENAVSGAGNITHLLTSVGAGH